MVARVRHEYKGRFDQIPPTSPLHRIVGFDIMSDELGFPYVPFYLNVFRLARRLVEDVTGKTFGFRIHAGESVPFPVDESRWGGKPRVSAFVQHNSEWRRPLVEWTASVALCEFSTRLADSSAVWRLLFDGRRSQAFNR